MDKLEKIKKDALGLPDIAKRMIVHNAATLLIANGFIKKVKSLMKEVSGSYDPIISHAKAEKKKYYDPLKESEKIVKLHVASYLEDQARIRRETEEKAKKEEEERQKEEDKILADAKVLEDSGKEKEAASLVAEIPLPARVEIPSEPDGLTLKRIVDVEKINQLVTKSNGLVNIPGIRVYPVWKWEVTDRKLIPKSYYKSSVASRSKEE